jgi:uncharacterized protein YbcI
MTKGQIESNISEAISEFELEQMRRRPKRYGNCLKELIII